MSVALLRLAVAVVLALPATAARAEDDECLNGSWEGKLGATTVSLEFRPNHGSDGTVGRYYYDRTLADLLLVADDDDPEQWQERDAVGRITGRWQFDCAGDRLGGRWQAPDGRRTLKLSAARTPSFDQRRLAALVPTASPQHDGQGHTYEALTVPGVPDVAALRLPGTAPGVTRINAQLLANLREDVGRALECSTFGRLWGPDAGWSHHAGTTVAAWFDDVVTLRTSSEGYCGGAHPYGDNGHRTFRLSDGETLRLSAWLADDYRTSIDRESPLGEALKRRYLERRADDDATCWDTLDFFPDFVALDPGGLVFPATAPYVSRPCEDDVQVDFDDVQPFLSEAGRQAVARLRGAAAAAPH